MDCTIKDSVPTGRNMSTALPGSPPNVDVSSSDIALDDMVQTGDEPAVPCITLRSTQWHQTLCQGLDNLRNKQLLCDVAVQTEDAKLLCAHKSVLGACSQKLLALAMERTCNSDKTDSMDVIQVPNVSHATMLTVLHFLYRGKVDVTQAEVGELSRAAEVLQLSELQVACVKVSKINSGEAETTSPVTWLEDHEDDDRGMKDAGDGHDDGTQDPLWNKTLVADPNSQNDLILSGESPVFFKYTGTPI